MNPTLMAILGLALGSVLVGAGVLAIVRSMRSQRWPTTQGQIETSNLDYGEDSYSAKLGYRYVVNGKSFRGTRVYFGTFGFISPQPVKRLLERYPAGSVVTVHYCPTQPRLATLETRFDKLDTLFVVGFGLAMMGVGMVRMLVHFE